jgi:hypothetical protein
MLYLKYFVILSREQIKVLLEVMFHFAGIITEKRHNFHPSTPPAGAENFHLMLNGETRRDPGRQRPDGLGRRRQGELRSTAVLPQTKPGPGQHSHLDKPTSTQGKKEELSNKQ